MSREPRICPVCAKTFEPSPHPMHRYCSSRCRSVQGARQQNARRKSGQTPRIKNLVDHPPRPCAWCGYEFKPRRLSAVTCSKKCSKVLVSTNWRNAHRDEYRARHRTYANASNKRDPRLMIGGARVRVSDLPPTLQPVALLIKEAREIIRHRQETPK